MVLLLLITGGAALIGSSLLKESVVLFSIAKCVSNVSLALAIVLILKEIPILKRSKFLMFVGMISFELYLVHCLLLDHLQQSVLGSILFLVVSISIAYLFSKLNSFNNKLIDKLVNYKC